MSKQTMMKLRLTLLALLLSSLLLAQTSDNTQIEKILEQLTLEEKAGQLNLIAISGQPTEAHLQLIREGKVGSILKVNGVDLVNKLQKIAIEESPSGLPILFQEDVIHGYKTIAPIPLAEVASWDLKAIQASAAVAAREASAAGIALTYAPMVDVCRDPRWGRILEGAGEDPYLGAQVAAVRVRGFQASNPQGQNVLGCVKHFAGYGASLAGRDYNIQDFSERELRETHLPTYQGAIDAGVASLMCAYSAYDGIPLCANSFLMKDVLRDEMGFDGLAMTDWSTIKNLVKTGITDELKTATEITINAGIDMDMTSNAYVKYLPQLVRQGIIAEHLVDDAVRRVLVLKQKAGLLDHPFAYLSKEHEKAELMSQRNIAETKEIALKSMVLLKNNDALLPLQNKKQNIAMIGPFAKAQKDLLGWWDCKGNPEDVVSYFEGIHRVFAKANISYAQGCRADSFHIKDESMIAEAVATAQAADVVFMCLGEAYWMSGEGGGTASLHLPGLQEELLAAVAKTGKRIVSIINAGRPYILTEVEKYSDAILYAWMPGTTGGTALGEILSGQFNPQAKLPITFPYHEGQVPIYYSYRRTSHNFVPGIADDRYSTSYRDIRHEPLYPFGYGMSYTSYSYGDIRLDQEAMNQNESIKVSIDITNTGSMKGTEIVQLYIGDVVCSVTRPERELKDFALVTLDAGETKTVSFDITSDKLAFIGRDYSTTLEKGKFKLYVGADSTTDRMVEFELK